MGAVWAPASAPAGTPCQLGRSVGGDRESCPQYLQNPAGGVVWKPWPQNEIGPFPIHSWDEQLQDSSMGVEPEVGSLTPDGS